MNRRANAYINLISFTSFILAFLLFIITMKIESMDNTIYLLRNITFLLTFISLIIFSGCEMLLFLLLQNKYKVYYILYLLSIILITIKINTIIPFIYTISFVLFKLIVDITRIVLVNKIYINRRFTTYCRRYGIKINDWKKTYKKKKTTSKKKNTVGVPVPANTASATTFSTNA